MNFMQFLKSLDDLLYEIMSWLVFYPVTLWRTIRHPWATMDYASRELSDTEEHQYEDTLSPPLFLLLTLLLSHSIELSVVGQSPLVKSNQGLAALITDDTSLLLIRLLTFSLFPLIMAVRLLRQRRARLTRDSLRGPFYAQCYLTGPFALAFSLGALFTQLQWPWVEVAGLVLMLGALLWYGGLQTRWFRRKLSVSPKRAFLVASIGMIECCGAIIVIAPLLT